MNLYVVQLGHGTKIKKNQIYVSTGLQQPYGGNQCAATSIGFRAPLFNISDVQLQACPNVVPAAAAVDVAEQRAGRASVSVPLFSTSPTCSCRPARTWCPRQRPSMWRSSGQTARAASRLRRCLGAIVSSVELGAISYSD